MQFFAILLFSTVLVAGCSTSPDMRTAAALAAAGNTEDARTQYRALANFGLPAARIALADSLAASGTEEQLQDEVRAHYRIAALRDPRGLGRLAKQVARDSAQSPASIDAMLTELMQRHARGEPVLAADIADFLLARGGGHNPQEVGDWALRAANVGDPRGHYLLGVLCEGPPGEAPDPACAVMHYRHAAPAMTDAAGALIAQAQRHPGTKTPAEIAAQAVVWHPGVARHAVYRAYRSRVGDQVRISVAETLLEELAAGITIDVAQPLDGISPSTAVDCARLLGALDENAAPARAAARDLAAAYAANTGVDARFKLVALLDRLQQADPLNADLLRADLLLAGNLVPIDPPQALAALSRQAMCSADAAYALGDLYRIGLLDEPDYRQATYWFERAGHQGLGKAWFVLARMYLYSPALAPDYPRARVYAARARDAGYLSVDSLLDFAPRAVREQVSGETEEKP